LGLRLPPDREPRHRVLNEAQLVALLSHPKQTLRIETMLRAAIEGGLRRSEIVGLKWTDVDIPNCRIEIRHGYEARTTRGSDPAPSTSPRRTR
jgi:integrase